MIILEKISIFELEKLVYISYEGDEDLLNCFWGESFNLEKAVNETMNAINQYQEETNMQHYAVLLDGKEIGYLSCFPHNLYSFGININYRTKEILNDFWEQIKDILGSSFICMLFNQNTRAIKFLKKKGMVEIEGVEQNCTTLLNIKT